MGQRHHHYEAAFAAFLRSRRIPYVSVNEARKSLLPAGAGPVDALKSFDYVVYGRRANLLLDVKGRRIRAASGGADPADEVRPRRRTARGHLDTWVTRGDIEALRTWEALFGPGFEAAFIFMHWVPEPPADGLFDEVFAHRGRWYALRAVRLANYVQAMRQRSPRWGTVDLPAAAFERLGQRFCRPALSAAGILSA